MADAALFRRCVRAGTPAGILLTLVSVGLSVAIAEVVVRVLDLPPRMLQSLSIPSYVLSEDPLLRYTYRPGYSARDVPFDDQHRNFSFNAHGFRDYEFTFDKPPGVKRVLTLGDSTTAGNGVPDVARIYPKLLERLLNQSGKGRYQVYNLAVGGYQTLQEAEMLKVRGLRYRPDLVLVGFCLNDFSYDADGGVYARLNRRLEEDSPGLMSTVMSAGQNWKGWIISRSRLAFVLYHRLHQVIGAGASATDFERRLRKRDPVDRGFEIFQRIHGDHRFPIIVVILPGFDAPFNRYRHHHIHKRVFQVQARYPDIQVVDLLEDLEKLQVNPRSLGIDGLHPNEAGHETIAQALYVRLKDMF